MEEEQSEQLEQSPSEQQFFSQKSKLWQPHYLNLALWNAVRIMVQVQKHQDDWSKPVASKIRSPYNSHP